ncbi:aldehyde-activating protein [Parasalinivibrio latis]|uniref:GFA family protein n=1 Tax=Parasalinivibrio latis TaxID=2952610 RepID=UPI0030DE9AE5
MYRFSCHCGEVNIVVYQKPQSLTRCNCSLCQRYSAVWGYFKPVDVEIDANTGSLDTYCWGDKMINFNRCKTCGCVTHYTLTSKTQNDKVGINFNMGDSSLINEIPIKYFDGASM